MLKNIHVLREKVRQCSLIQSQHLKGIRWIKQLSWTRLKNIYTDTTEKQI